jgi:ABC-2 type transport system ATP-binding protein
MTAVDGIDLEMFPGEIVACVGPNGAGKSTTIKLLTGLLVPTDVEVEVCGITPWRHLIENAFNMGVVFGQCTRLWWDIPVQESLRLLGDIYQLDADTWRRTFDELVEVLDLAPLRSVPARQLSVGQRMRCDLAASLVHAPPVLYLDEPSIGLDVSVKARFREFVRTMHRERGLTVMLTSHDLGDIEELCERLVMIDMVRPLNYRTTMLASASGFAVVEGIVSFGIAIGLGLLFFDIRSPDSALAGRSS